MCPSPSCHLQAGTSTSWGSALSLCNPWEAKQDSQPPCQGFPSHVFPSLGGKGAHGARPPSSSQHQLLPQGGRGELGLGKKKAMHRGNSMRKPTRCQLCQVVQHSKCHCGFLFCSLSPKQESQTPPCQRGPLPSPHFISSKTKASRVSPQHPQPRRLLPMVRFSRSELEPPGPCPALGSRQRGAVPSGCCRHAAVPPALPSCSLRSPRKTFHLFSSSQAAAPLRICSG